MHYYQIQYGTNRQYYGLCVGPENDPFIYACPANSFPNLTSFPATCDYRCWRVGFFENTLDSTKFFECYLNNFLQFGSIERKCPTGSKFSSTRSECVSTIQGRSLNIIKWNAQMIVKSVVIQLIWWRFFALFVCGKQFE